MIANDIRFAVGYARRSTDLQERSLPDQKVAVERWARDHGFRILRWFVDDAISGTSANTNNVSTLDTGFADPDMEALRQQLNEMILNGRR